MSDHPDEACADDTCEIERLRDQIAAQAAEVAIVRSTLGAAREKYDAAEKECAELRREMERRYDCHGGPGTATPACGACVTCVGNERDRLRSALAAIAALLQQENDGTWRLRSGYDVDAAFARANQALE